MTVLKKLSLLAVFIVFTPMAFAQSDLVEANMEAMQVVTDESGKETLKPAESADPGTVIQYKITYKNVSNEAINGLAVNGPIPDGTTYMEGTQQTEIDHAFDVSVDEGNNWHVPPFKVKFTDANGVEKEREANATDFTNLRWKLASALEPNQTQDFIYRVKVD